MGSFGQFENARSVSDNPKNYKQVYDLSLSNEDQLNELVETLDHCSKEAVTTAFIRDAKAAPEKNILSTDN